MSTGTVAVATGAVTYGSGYAAARMYSRKMSKRVADISEFEFVRLTDWDQLPAEEAQKALQTYTSSTCSPNTAYSVVQQGASSEGREGAMGEGGQVVKTHGNIVQQGATAGRGKRAEGGKGWGGWWEDRKQLKWTKGLVNKAMNTGPATAPAPPPQPVGTVFTALLR